MGAEIMDLTEPTFSFGIEEEYLLVDKQTRMLASAPPELFERLQAAAPGQIAVELLRSQIEVGTRPAHSFSAARADLAHLRQTVVELAGGVGLAPIAASSHPIGGYRSQETTENERYVALASDLAGVGRRMVVCGMHIHVGIEDNDLRIDLLNQARYFLPHLLTLSTSSPFWEGEDTGLKSFRIAIFNGLPRTGLPGPLSSWDEFCQMTGLLSEAGVIDDASKIWWDLRPSIKFPTLEMRITDVCTRIEDAVSVAALFVCLCRMLYRLRRNNQSWRQYPVFLLEENRWRAQRYGIDSGLFDFGRGALVPFPDLIDELLELVEEDAEVLGCREEVGRVRNIARTGTSADRQVKIHQAALAAGSDGDAALRAVVDDLIEQTANVVS